MPADVGTGAALDATLLNALDNSDAVFVEAYESVLWTIRQAGGPLDATAAVPRTLADWDEEFDVRRRSSQFAALADPYPSTHRHTFTRPSSAVGALIYHYVDPSRCAQSSAHDYGVVRVLE
jgi:hypothetical protein